MATLENFLSPPGINGLGLYRDGYVWKDLDFAKTPCASGDVLMLFELPPGWLLFGIGAKLIKAEPATVGDAVVKFYTRSNAGVVAEVTTTTTPKGFNAVLDVDALDLTAPAAMCYVNASENGAYCATGKTVFVALVLGGAMKQAQVRVFAKIGRPPIA